MGNQCCFNIKYRFENDEKREIVLMQKQDMEKDISLDLNDSNQNIGKVQQSSSRQSTSQQNSARGNKKLEYNTTTGTTTDPKSYPQYAEALINNEQSKLQALYIGIYNYDSSHPAKQRQSDINAQQKVNHHSNSEKMLEMEKKLQLLESYINEKQISEQMNMNKQPSIIEKLYNDNKEADEKSIVQDLISPSNLKAIELQYFEQYQFDVLLRLVDQMQQTSLRDASSVSISTSAQQMTSVNLDKVYKLKDTGDIYVGSWNDKNQKEGFGKLFGANGIYYEGEWVADKFEGRGIYIESDKLCIKGSFKNGIPHGNCILVKIMRKLGSFLKKKETTKDNDDYDEISRKTSLLTINSEFHGFVQSKYKGEINNGQKHGNGELVIDKKLRYVGGFANDQFNGYGICVWYQGGVYEGQWVNDIKEGKGQELWPSGKSYTGEYLNDLFHGYGQQINEDGEIYEGFWSHGEMDGQGILTRPDQSSIYGQWQNGVLKSTIPL